MNGFLITARTLDLKNVLIKWLGRKCPVLASLTMLTVFFTTAGIVPAIAQTVLIDENFTSAWGSTAPTGWTATQIAEGNWAFNNPGGRTLTGGTPGFSGKFAIFDSDYICSWSGGEEATLESPAFNASQPGTLTLEFDNSYRTGTTSGWMQQAHVEVWNGTAWTDVLTLSSTTTGSDGYPNPASHKTINITTAAGTSASAKVRFHSTNGNCDWWWAIDNVKITRTAAATCAAPTAPVATTITATTALLNWTQSGTPAQWQIKYGPAGFNVNTAGTSVFTTTKPYTLNPPLTSTTAYSYYVRAVCGPNDTSAWSAVTNFTTLAPPITCAAPTAPTAATITATTASLNWTQTGTPAQWQIKYGSAGFNVNTAGTSIFTTTRPYTLNPPLAPATAYSYYVRAVCGPNDTSAWSAVTNFTTLCIPPTIVAQADSFNCGPGTVVLKATASAGGSIKWYAAATGGTALFTGNVFTTPALTANTTYYITAASGTCESTPRQAVTASIRTIPVVSIGNDTTICPGITYTMDAGNPGAIYNWNTGATTQSIVAVAAGSYSVQVTVNKCSASDTRVISAGVVPQNNLAATLDLCAGSSAILNAGNTGSSYHWTPGGETTQTINITTGGPRSVTIRSATGCEINSSTAVTLRPLPLVNLGKDTAFCEGNSLTLDAGNTGAGFLWNTGATSQTLNVDATGNYNVVVTDNYNCKGRDTISIIVKGAPSGTINAIYGDVATYTFNVINANFISSYTWDFGDGSPLVNGAQVQHRYTRNGIFTVSVTLGSDCTDALVQSRTVDVFDGEGSTGIVSQEEAGDLLLYPNPARDQITLSHKNANWKPELYRIVNVQGLTVETGKFSSGNHQRISVASLVSGIYIIHIITDHGLVVRKFEVLK